mmetsp:Transcript_8746/g.15086  ORF Transcript_8746/g.15086 Transcript_8746/m.15086 type:complete len:83 (+) Transcript_8746:133-381(+)
MAVKPPDSATGSAECCNGLFTTPRLSSHQLAQQNLLKQSRSAPKVSRLMLDLTLVDQFFVANLKRHGRQKRNLRYVLPKLQR